MSDELVPFLRKNYSATSDPKRTAVGGASLGGLAAAHLALQKPQLFGNVLSQSGSFWWVSPTDRQPEEIVRDSLNSPLSATIDFRVLKYFPFGGVKRLDLVTEFFNLLNRANISQIDPVFGSGLQPIPQFRQPITGSGTRQIQFSLDFEF